MLITPARAQPFGGPAGCCGGDSAFAPPDYIVNAVAWALLIVILIAFAWPVIKRLARRLFR